MADIDNLVDAGENTKQKTKNIVARHPLRTGTVGMAALFGSGYLLGHKRAESQSLYNRFKREFTNLR